eukprot:11182898-Lingulodinium_polyedra.AAC.1
MGCFNHVRPTALGVPLHPVPAHASTLNLAQGEALSAVAKAKADGIYIVGSCRHPLSFCKRVRLVWGAVEW